MRVFGFKAHFGVRRLHRRTRVRAESNVGDFYFEKSSRIVNSHNSAEDRERGCIYTRRKSRRSNYWHRGCERKSMGIEDASSSINLVNLIGR